MKRLYRLLLRIYPPGFREEYARDLECQFADEYREAEGPRERVLLALRAVKDLAVTAPGEIARELRQDLRYAAHLYRRRWLATALALAAMSLAIGATTGIFSVLNALLIRSLPFRDAEQLVQLDGWPSGGQGRSADRAWLAGSRYLQDAALYAPQPMNLTVGQGSWRVTVAETSANFLRLLGAEPEFGRDFSPDEDLPGRQPTAVIGYGLWQQAFGGDPRAVGSTIRLNGTPLTVVGVAPRNFDFPEQAGIWTSSAYAPLRSLYFLPRMVGRLKPGIPFQQAAAMYQADIKQLPGPQAPQISSLRDRLAGPVRPASLVLMGMMAFVLLIACANLAHLLLSRATERRQEFAIRTALGASRARLARQLVTEATVLTSAAAIAGLAVAEWTARLAAAAQPAQLASRQYSVLDWRVLAFAIGLAAVTGILFGVLPAAVIGRSQPGSDIIRQQPGSRGSAAGRTRVALIALQAALTVVLAAGAFSMGRSFLRLMGIDLGFHTTRIVTMSVSLPATEGRTAPFVRRALERLRAIPGVESASAASYLPLVESKIQEGTFFRLDLRQATQTSRVMQVSPDYFRTMGTPVIEGREFAAADQRRAEPVVIVTQEFARLYPGQKLVGRKIYLEPAQVWATIIGIVQSQRFLGPADKPWEVIYRPMDQYEQWFATFVVKVRNSPARYLAVCRGAVQEIDRTIPVFDVKTLRQRLDDTVSRPRFYTTAILFLTGFALLLAAIGAYGAATHSVSQRRHEIGIRIAVGGPPARVRGMIFRQSMAPVCAGALAGLLAAAGLHPFLKHLLASVEPDRIWMRGGAALAIALATAAAVWIGTSRVVRTDPTSALRVE